MENLSGNAENDTPKANGKRETMRGMKQSKYDVFISYRRDNGAPTAKHLRDILVGKGYRVFFDTDSLRNGDFNTALLDVIRQCTDFIIILSPNALDRCVNEGDWVRQELACALQAQKNVIPVMNEKFRFPDVLPQEIDGVRWKNGVIVNMDYFDAMVKKLVSFLKSKPKKKSALRWLLPAALCAALAAGALIWHPWLGVHESAVPPAAGQETASPAAAADPSAAKTDSAWQNNVLREDSVSLNDLWSSPNLPAFGSSITRREIGSISILSSTAGAPADAWDVSQRGDRSVLAWTVKNGELYDLCIAGDGGVAAPQNCRGLFCGYSSAASIEFGDSFHTDNVQNMMAMFFWVSHVKKLDLSSFKTDRVTNMHYLFGGCSGLEELDLSSFDTSRVTVMDWMFFSCTKLKAIDVSSFNTSRVTSMIRLFNGCGLTALDISNFDTSNTSFMNNMFDGCWLLDTLNLGKFDTSSLQSSDQMFNRCESLANVYYEGSEADWRSSGLAEWLPQSAQVHFGN